VRITLLLELAAEAVPERIAVEGPGVAMTYRELYRRARNLASHIASSPVTNVVYLTMNSWQFPTALFAAAAAGKPFSPLNYRLPDQQLRSLVSRLAPAIVVADAATEPRIRGLPDTTVLTPPQFESATNEPASEDWQSPDEGPDVAVLLFTSGTSGEPKAARLKHANLTAYVLQTVEFASAPGDEAVLVSVPPYHIAAVSSMLTSIYAGRRIVQLEPFTPEQWVDMAQRCSVTHAMLVPTMLRRVLDVVVARSSELPGLRALAYGGGPMPSDVIHRALELLPHVDFANAYGLTETSSTISILGPDDHHAARRGDVDALRRLASVGKPLPGVEVEVRDDNGACVSPATVGEVWVRGEQVSGEYVGVKVTDDRGWFPTRDRGWFDEGGYLFIDGRLDDVIVRGGENISPGEIEDVLRLHPAVEDCAVIGAPDEEWGEKIVAFIVPRAAKDVSVTEIQGWVRGRLRSTKTPADVVIRQALPYNETGKLLRRVLRDDWTASPAR